MTLSEIIHERMKHLKDRRLRFESALETALFNQNAKIICSCNRELAFIESQLAMHELTLRTLGKLLLST